MLPGNVPLGKLRIAVFQDHIDANLIVSTVRREATPVGMEHVCGLGLILLDFLAGIDEKIVSQLCDGVVRKQKRPHLRIEHAGHHAHARC
jgi:hypothetical protein